MKMFLVLPKANLPAKPSAPDPLTARNVAWVCSFVVDLAHVLREILLGVEPRACLLKIG